ncbi:unnamed protein product [Owenia fusiformis]|uniref:Protein regulator of cytokinesis 1 n=1 Tax=Owenia fusiformis TaxID=6347 RepID=A0A8S4NRQ2_OWEFU|nr:unnamed protein product [Owenia fusiformis]
MSSQGGKMKEHIVQCLDFAMGKLTKIWDDIGICQDQRKERAEVVLLHLKNLLEEMVKEEEGLKKNLLQNVETYGEELVTLHKELNIPSVEPKKTLTILQLEKDLRTRVDNLSKMKHERMKILKKLKETDQALCDALCTTPYYIPTGTVPSQEQIKTLEEHITTLTTEKERRATIFGTQKKSIVKMMEALDQLPSTDFERDIICEEDDTFLLSSENMKALKTLHEELEVRQQQNFSTANQLRERVTLLWDRLEVEGAERAKFLSEHAGFKPKTITALREEVTRLEELKLQNIQRFVEAMRREVETWWNKCYYSDEQRAKFKHYKNDNYSEELLEIHEKEVAKIKEYYEENKAMLDRVARREKLWEDMMEFERRAADPNRFTNRGGGLLKEEKDRKKLMKDLPKVEQELDEAIGQWEQENKKEFRLKGMRFMDYVTYQWEEYAKNKEMEKQNRHKRNAKIMEEEMHYGSKPTTPAKRRFLGTTPNKNTPNKQRRTELSIASSRTPNSTLGSRTPNRTRTGLRSRQADYTAGFRSPPMHIPGLKSPAPKNYTPKQLRPTPQRMTRKALTDRNETQNPFSQTTMAKEVNDVSVESTGSYKDFANGLNPKSRPNCRSSVVPSSQGVTHLL